MNAKNLEFREKENQAKIPELNFSKEDLDKILGIENQLNLFEKTGSKSDATEKVVPLRLIGGNLYPQGTFRIFENSIYSIDDLYLNFKINPTFYDDLVKMFDTKISDDFSSNISTRANCWRSFWCFSDGSSSIRVGLGWNKIGGKIKKNLGFVQFNPNKCPGGFDFLHKIGITANQVEFEIKRFDLAIDFLKYRNKLRLLKDQRKYEYCSSKAITEYLGQRSKPGRIKLYDKTAELKHQKILKTNLPITRVELTCDGKWSIDEIMHHLPAVFDYNSLNELKFTGTTQVLCVAMAEICSKNGQIDSFLKMMSSRKTATKIKNALKKLSVLEYDRYTILQVIGDLRSKIF